MTPILLCVHLTAICLQCLMECSHTVSLHFHQLHDTYAAVLIAPSAKDSGIICNNLKRDNLIYEDLLMQGRSDPG